LTLLQQLNRERAESNEALRLRVRARLRTVLRQFPVIEQVVVFGSLTKPHRFTSGSDIDLALETEPPEPSLYQLTALLAEEMARPVDIILLPKCRFRDRIAREGEKWILAA
jgi:predicted nucleotidyltransferase